jgi:hypothetical protein
VRSHAQLFLKLPVQLVEQILHGQGKAAQGRLAGECASDVDGGTGEAGRREKRDGCAFRFQNRTGSAPGPLPTPGPQAYFLLDK